MELIENKNEINKKDLINVKIKMLIILYYIII